jgi:hypothetical protein
MRRNAVMLKIVPHQQKACSSDAMFGFVLASSPCCPGLTRLLVVVLDQWRTGKAKRACEPRGLLDKLLVRKAIKPTNIPDFATIDDEARISWPLPSQPAMPRKGFQIQRHLPGFFQFGQNAIATY